eukprot:comp22377_c0_seq1/m.33361 comp22377_c0_seq1/g.33361  ORF comp22377_c0_seq1/g.33361 comp22377_c0_seq1/m.33361 type:complete len:252 (-) comp22377_c0_seq1:16-771(-)
MAHTNGCVADDRDQEIQRLKNEVALLKAAQVKGVDNSKPLPTPDDRPFQFDSIPDALEAIRQGEFVVVLDDEDRENEGDLIAACSTMTAEKMAFMIRHTSGVICVSIPEQRQQELELPIMVQNNTEKHCTAFTVTLDYNKGTTTGISASDRAATCRAMADPTVRPDDFNRPGHIFPLVSREGGVLTRTGHTEATHDLCKLAGLPPVGALCEIALDDGRMARREHLEGFSRMYGLKMITIEALAKYRRENNL